MGDGPAPLPTALPPGNAAPPPPPPVDEKDKGDKPKAADGAKPPPSPAAPPPNEQELKKITSEVASAGVKLPPELLDEKGNIKPDQVAAAKKFIAEEAAKRKDKDLGAASRLYQRALKLDPEDKQLRIDAAKTTKAWADTQKKPDVKKALIGDAIALLKPGKEDTQEIALLGDYARELASLYLKDGKPAEARQVLASAAPKLNIEELDKTYAFLTAPENSDLLEEGQHPWMFLGDALMQEKNYELAAIAYTRGVNVAQKDKNFPLRDEFNNKFSLAHEAKYPYQTEFADPATGQVSNAAANAFYRSLQAQGIPASAMDKEVDGKSDNKISSKEVYAYIGEHLDDPKVQAVLAMAKINIAEGDKKLVKTVGFGIWMADHYTKEAERLKKEDPEKNAPGVAKLLTFAADLDPENPKRAEALGDFYSEQKAYPLAMQAYAEAQKAYKALPPPNQNPRAMEGFTQMQEEAAKRLKGKIDDMFEKGLKATGQAYEKEGTDLATKLQLVQTLEGQYELYGELYPDEAQKPDRIRQMGLTYGLIAQNLQAAGKGSEAKAYYAKAVEKYQAAINANKNDAVFCIQTYKMMGDANHQIGDYKAALIAYSMAAQCQKLRINYKSGDQLPSLSSVKQDRAPGQFVSEADLGNYLLSDVHDIRRVDGLDAIPNWADGPRENYIAKLKAQIDGGPAAREALRAQNPPDLQKIYDSLESEAKLLTFFRREDEAKKIGEEAAKVKVELDHKKLSDEVTALGKSGLLDQKGLDAVTDRENKGQATTLKFSDYVKFERSGDKVTFKFTPAYEKLDTESQNRVMHAMMSAAQRNQISRNAEKAKGPAKLFYEGQLAVFDEDRATAKSKFEQFAKEAKGTQDPALLRMLQQTEGVMQILNKDGKQKPSDVMRDLRIVLAPLAMTLKPGQDGGLDLSAISKTEVKSFEDFRQYLASQVSVDGVSFNAAIFASYEKVLKSPKHEALLKHLYAEFNADAAGDAPKMTTEQLQAALRDFQRDIIDVSAGRFVGNQLSSKEGRGRLRALLQDETLDRGIRAKLCEEIVEQGQGQGFASSAMVVAFDEKVNSYGFWLQEGKLDLALRYGFRVLDAGDHQDVTHNAHIEKYEKYPQEIQRLQSDKLDHQVTPKSIQDMAKMVQAQSGKSDGVSIMRAKLGTMWLTVVDNDSWGVESTVDRHKSYVPIKQRAEMANTLHQLLSEADTIGTEQEFLAWSQRVRRFMRGQGSGKKDDIAAKAGEYLGKGAEDLVGEAGEKLSWAVSDTTEDAFKGLKPAVSHSYNDLLRYVDEIHSANLHGVSVEVLDPDVAVTDPAQKEKTMKLIQDLRGMKRGFWYNYQQRNLLSRSLSEQGDIVGIGDINSINAANKEIDGLISDLQKAKTTEDFEKIKARMTRATREGGAIHKGFADSEMEGTEQVINLVQTIAEIVVITVATQGIGTEAALGRAAATFGQTALRTRNLRLAYQAFSEVRSVANMARAAETLEMANMARYGSLYREMQGVGRLGALASEDAAVAKGFQGILGRGARAIGGEAGFGAKAASGFKMGATISLTENMLGSLSGQLKTDPTTLLDWLKDATATGLSMVVSAGLSPSVGEQVQQNIMKGLWQRYVAGGAKSAIHFLADTGLEVIEEVVDNYVRKKLDGDFSKMSWDELRDITMVCFIGGVKQGVTSHFTNFTKAKIADYQVKKLNQGFSDRGERIVQDPKRGYVLVDREGRYLKKVDETAMQAFLVFDAETHGDGAKGVVLVEFESGEKGAHGKPVQVEVEGFPEVKGEAPPKSADELKKEQEEKAAAQRERAVEKAKNEKQRKLYGQFLEKGEKVQEVKRKDGVVIGLALVDASGKKVRDATVDELAAYQRYTQLVEGFETRKERVLGTQAQGFYLADEKGNKLGDASQADLSLYLKFKKKQVTSEARANQEAAQKKKASEEHEAAIAKRAQELAPDFESGVVIRPQIKKADSYQRSDVNDPEARAFKGPDGKVGYFVKVSPEGKRSRPSQKEVQDFLAGKAPTDQVVGFEKVGADGKVMDGPIAKDDFEAYQHWYAQKKEAAKVVVLRAVEAVPPESSDEDKTPVAVPRKKASDSDPEMRRAADAAQAFNLSFDQAAQAGKPLTIEALTKKVQEATSDMDALRPALDGLPDAKRQAAHDFVLQQLISGKMTREQSLDFVEKLKKGEVDLEASAKADSGFEVKGKPEVQGRGGEETIDSPPARTQAVDDLTLAAFRVTSDLELDRMGRKPAPEWLERLKTVEEGGDPDEKAIVARVREAAEGLRLKVTEYLKAKSSLKDFKEGSSEYIKAQQRVEELKAELGKNIQLIRFWQDLPYEAEKIQGHMQQASFPYLQRMIQGKAAGKDAFYSAPEGVPILDVHLHSDTLNGKHETILVVRNEADAQALLKEVRLNHGENKAQFIKDPDGKVRAVQMTTPDGKVFSVRVQLATPENRADITDRGGVAGASHEGIGYKDHNEDRQVVITFENGRTVTLVIDGMGGTEGGEMAAKLAKDAFEKAVKEGKSVEEGIHLANEAVAAYGKELLPALTEKLMKEKGYDKPTAEYYAKSLLPGAVAMGTEITRNADGTYNARFRSVGDCEAAVVRFKPNGEVEILDAYGRSEAEILKSRSDPNANIVDQSLGGHTGPLKLKTKDVTLQKGDIVLNGSDGFFENFGSHAEIAFLIQQSGAKTPGEIRDVLMRESLIRQKLADTLEKSGKENMVLTPQAYAEAYRAVTGMEPPSGWKGMWEGKILDMMGNVGEAKDLGTVSVTYADGQSFEFQGVPRDKTQGHFKKDNTTLVVQSVGDPVRADTPTPSRAELVREQLALAQELARAFGLEKNADFMKDLNALVVKDIALAGRGLDVAGRNALIAQRSKEAKALAERYGLQKNTQFMKGLGRLVVDNLRQAEIRFGTAPAKLGASDPKLDAFMEKQRGYGLKLANSFEGKVDPAKRQKFKMDLGKLLSQDAAGLPSGGDAAVEAKFRADREAVVLAFAKEYGLDGDPKFMKAAQMLLVDRVMKECPRVEVRGPKIDPAVQKAAQRLESEIYDRALRAGRNKEEAAQLAEDARVHFDKAIKSGKGPDEAFKAANDLMAAEFKETIRPAAPQDATPDQKDTVLPGKQKAANEPDTPSGVRPANAGDNIQIPKAPKAFDGDAVTRKASYEVGLYDRIFPEPIGRPGVRNMDITGELDAIRERLVEGGHQALLDKFDADYKALKEAPQDSPEYQAAIERLGDVLALNHGDARFRTPVVFMSDADVAAFAKASMEIYAKSEGPAPSAKQGKGADVIPLRPRAKSDSDSEIRKAADTDPEGLRARMEAKDADPKKVLEPFEGIEKALEATHPELSAKLKADRETILKGDKESDAYKDAMQRLTLLDAAMRGPLEYGKGMKPENLETLVRPLYEDQGPPSSKPPSDSLTPSFGTGTGIALGLLSLLLPDTAQAAEGPLQQIQQSLHVGPFEALMILGIGTLIGLPMIRKFWSGTKGPSEPPPATRDNPVRIERDGKVSTIRPFEKRDMQSGRVIEGTIGTFSKADSEVIGDSVHLAIETFDPVSGNKKSTDFVTVSKEDARRLGVKFNKAGDEIAEMPKTEFLLQDIKGPPAPDLKLAADAAPKDKPVVLTKDPQGQETEIKDLSLFDPTKGAGALRSFAKATSVEVSKDNPNQVTVRVDVYDPADPKADPTSLAFGIGKPEVVEQRSFTMTREEASSLGLPLGEPGVSVTVTEQKLLLLNDKASDIGAGNALYIPTSNEGGHLIYPAHTAGKKAIAGKIVTVDADRTSVLGDTVYVFFRTVDMPGKKGSAIGAEPIPMSLAEARKLGIALGHGGKLRVEKNQFILSEVAKGKGKDVLVDGKPFEDKDAPVSVRFKVGDDGKIHLTGTDGKDLAPPKVEAGMLTGEGAQGLKIPDAVKVLGPTAAGALLLFAPSIAEASTSLSEVAMTGGLGMAIIAGLGTLIGLPFIFRNKGDGNTPKANHPPLQVGDGKTYFQVMADVQGKPVVDQFMGPVSPPLLTFQRGPKGQWYAFEGKPSKDFYESMQDPALSRMWRPVKDGDLFQIGEHVIPFQAPKEGWIQYQMPDGSVMGYAPPDAPPSSVPPPLAVSGKLPVGETRIVVPKADGSPFVIGRGQGDLQFTDTSVSGVHATIVRNQADGKWYLVDGPMGDAGKVSTNGIYVKEGRMPKYYPIQDGEYFIINGATFQFRAPAVVAAPAPAQPAPVAPVVPLHRFQLQKSPEGYPMVQVANRPYSIRPWNLSWEIVGDVTLGRVVSSSKVPNDPQGRVRMELRTSRLSSTEEGAITLEMTPAEAAELGIRIRADGSLDPTTKPLLRFDEMAAPAQLPKAADNPQPVFLDRPVIPARPLPPAPPAKVPVELTDGAGQPYRILSHQPHERLREGEFIADVKRLEPLPGNSGGKLFMVVELRENLNPDGPVKTVTFSVTPDQAQKMGLKLDSQGRLTADSPRGLTVALLQTEGPRPVPKAPAPIPGQVQGVWADNLPGTPRRGKVGNPQATDIYGTSAGETHEGIGYKDKNEDAVIQGPNWAIVLDGMGGHKGGDAASQISGKAIAKFLQDNQGKMPPGELLTKALEEGDRALRASQVYSEAPEKKKPGAVGVLHYVVKNPDGSHSVFIAHIGDAAAIIVGKDGKIKHRTADQSYLNSFYKQVMSGKIKGEVLEAYLNAEPKLRPFYEAIQKHGNDPVRMEMEIRSHPYANIVSGGLGTGEGPHPVVQEFKLEPGDRIVMFSDGVGDANSSEDLAKIVAEAPTAKAASDRIMGGTLERMADLEDAMAELPPGKRLPIVRTDGEIAYVDNKGNIYKSLTPEPGEEVLDHYKADNLTAHVYFHDPKSAGPDSGGEDPVGGVKKLIKLQSPPPLPPRPKQGTQGGPVKPVTDINFKAIPRGNQLAQGELEGLERLDKRSHVAQILHDPNLRPVTKVKVGGQTFYLSRIIESVDEKGEVRPHILALVPVQEGGKTVLKRRFFYKSNSDGGWRASPYQVGGHIAKGVGRHYTQETQPIPELNEAFQYLEDAGSGFPKLRMKDEEFANYIDVGSPLLDQAAQQTMLGGFSKEIFFPSNVGMTDIGGLQPGKAFKAGGFNGASDPNIVPKLANLRYPDGFIPDFSQQPSRAYQETHTLLGPITCREFSGGFLVEKGTGRKRPVIWTMAEDSQGRTWVKAIRFTDSKVNSYGVYDEVIDSGIITYKPLEYRSQSFKLPSEYRPDFNDDYVDITPALNMLKPIRQYRQARGLSNPEIPQTPIQAPAPIQPMSPPVAPVQVVISKPLVLPVGTEVVPPTPVNGTPVASASVPGLSGIHGQWEYRMPSNQIRVTLGRDDFMGIEESRMISGKHIQIYRDNGTTFIRDSMSMNGTQVIRDGKVAWTSRGKSDLIPSLFPLHPGDRIVMGEMVVVFNPS